MILIIIITYLTILCWYSLSKIKKNVSLIVHNQGQLLIQIITIIAFFVFFIFGIRVLNLFRQHKVINLFNICSEYNFYVLTIIIVLMISFRNLVIYLFKVSWFKLHYVMMCQNNFSFYQKYRKFYFTCIYSPAFFSFKYFFYMNYIFTLGLLVFFLLDLIFNCFVLNYSLWYLKYYSLFRIVYMCYHFMIKKQNLLLDYYSYNLLYPGGLENNFFLNFKDLEHINLIEESKKYNSGVILEKTVYISKNFRSAREMAFFKELEK